MDQFQSSMIALLGRQDHPTDGVKDYCTMLRRALEERGCQLEVVRVQWATHGWLGALRRLWRQTRGRQGCWLLVQYTALSWSRRGFPFSFLLVLGLLRFRGARVAVVFHDAAAYRGFRIVDRFRESCQRMVMVGAYRFSQKSILNVPLEQVSWLPHAPRKASFIPIGSNIPAADFDRLHGRRREPGTIAVFGITGGGAVGSEVADIAFVAKEVAKVAPGIALVTLGRGSVEAEPMLRKALDGAEVSFSALGVLPEHEVSTILSGSELSLFVRGPLSTQRGSAIASIACGVPMVAYSGSLPAPIHEAGVLGIEHGNRQGLAEASIRVLTDHELWRKLRSNHKQAYEKHFAWHVIARQFVEVLGNA